MWCNMLLVMKTVDNGTLKQRDKLKISFQDFLFTQLQIGQMTNDWLFR